MGSIYYRFKSQNQFKPLHIEGMIITVSNLRKRLLGLIKLRRGDGLLIFNCQTNEEYMNGDTMISRNTRVLLQRVPPAWPIPTLFAEQKERISVIEKPTSCLSKSIVDEIIDLTWGDFGDDPFSTVISDEQNPQLIESKSDAYSIAEIGRDNKGVRDGAISDSHLTVGREGRKRKVPPIGYICHRCETPGHYIQHCPTSSDQSYANKRIRRSSGAGAVLEPDHATFSREMEKVPTMASTQSITDVPLGLRCPLCREVMKEASIALKCCMKSFCDKCIRDHIIKTKRCECGASNVLVENLKPNRTIRDIIDELLSWSSCTSSTNSSTITSLSS
ncbi:hypothetical protein LUZ62_053309 [Rhynchospora pubera]|uniref:DWNN domain-containing protein n=1 Tax=Rhynchospora pubera TaxID=906938 RepID=A0AAV8DS52_9POAL|nr:hypothetical protein LUZ62_053309 [Rhynchospora pubera]